MKKHFLGMAASFAIIVWGITSCQKDLVDTQYTPPPVSAWENDKFLKFLGSLPNMTMPVPSQFNVLNQNEINGDTFHCETKTINETSPEHSELLLPNPTDIYVPGWVYQLNSILDGGDQPFTTGIGGKRTLTLRAGAYSDTVSVGPESHQILEAIGGLQKRLPDHAQNVDIIVEEIYSARQAAVRFKATYNGTFTDFAASLDYSSEDYKHKYMVVLRVHDFDIDVSNPKRPIDWFPGLDSTQYGLIGGYSPVYVDKISFGKYMMMLVETNVSKFDLQAAVSASFGGVFSGGGFDSNGEYHTLKSSSRITIKAIGGDADAATALISGEPNAVKNYLEKIAADKTGQKASPLFCSFRFLKDNSRARVVLATDDYIIRNCISIPAKSYTFESSDYFNYKVNMVGGGDGDFGGDGYPYILGNIYLEIRNERELWLVNKTSFYELRENYTQGEAISCESGNKDVKLFSLPAGEKIVRIITPALHTIEYNDQNHSVEVFPQQDYYPSDFLVKKIFINGDTGGDDIPSDNVNTDRSWMKLLLNKIIVEIK